MNWTYLIKAIGVTSMYFGLAALGMVGMFAVAYYVPPWLFLVMFFSGIAVALIRAQYTHYKRMDEIEASSKKWKAEMDKAWDKIK